MLIWPCDGTEAEAAGVMQLLDAGHTLLHDGVQCTGVYCFSKILTNPPCHEHRFYKSPTSTPPQSATCAHV